MSEPQMSFGGRIGFVAAWYDFWVGVYWDRTKRRLYILPLPCLGIFVQFALPPKGGQTK